MPELGQDLRYGQRMRDVRFAALAQLAAMHLFGHGVRAAQFLRISTGMDAPMRTDEKGNRIGPGL